MLDRGNEFSLCQGRTFYRNGTERTIRCSGQPQVLNNLILICDMFNHKDRTMQLRVLHHMCYLLSMYVREPRMIIVNAGIVPTYPLQLGMGEE